MNPFRVLSAALSICLGGAYLPAAPSIDLERVTPIPADQAIPIQDFFRKRLLVDPMLNPSGTHLAALITASEDRRSLLVVELATNKVNFYPPPDRCDVADAFWLDDQRLVTRLIDSKLYALGLFARDISKTQPTYPILQFAAARLIGIPRDQPLRPLFWVGAALEGRGSVGAVELSTKFERENVIVTTGGSITTEELAAARKINERHIRKIYPWPKEVVGDGYKANYLCDKDGRLAYCVNRRQGRAALHRYVDGQWLASPLDLDAYDLVGVGDQPDQLVVRSLAHGTAPRPLQFMNAATGEAGAELHGDKDYDVVGWLYRDRATGAIAGVQYTRVGAHAVWFDEVYRGAQRRLNAQFPNQIVRIISNNKERTVFLVAAFSDRQPAVYHWVDFERKAAGLIKASAPWLDPRRMRPMSAIQFKTRDGGTLDAYVTMPEGATKEQAPPLVVLCHGGPWARDDWGFDAEAQFLASRGYAVLQVNYRGSTGYDWRFPREDRYAFRKMSDDVTDATRTLLDTGLVDRERVAIMGASFGGYLALSGVVHEPDLYRCAVSNAGVFDWKSMMSGYKYDQHTTDTYDRLRLLLGDPSQETQKYRAISPVNFLENLRVPVFVAHGKDDPIAPVSQSRDLVARLKRLDKPHEAMFTPDEGHGMAHLANQVELYGRIEAFLARHLAHRK